MPFGKILPSDPSPSDAMTTDNKKVKIEINIGGERLLLSVPFAKQTAVRECEKEINTLYSDWRIQFPKKSPSELLAMMAYQFASYYLELNSRMDRLNSSMESLSLRLSDLLEPDNSGLSGMSHQNSGKDSSGWGW